MSSFLHDKDDDDSSITAGVHDDDASSKNLPDSQKETQNQLMESSEDSSDDDDDSDDDDEVGIVSPNNFATSQTQPIGWKESTYVPPIRPAPKGAAAQEIEAIAALLGPEYSNPNNNNNNNKRDSAMPSNKENDGPSAQKKKTVTQTQAVRVDPMTRKRWPTIEVLATAHPDIVTKMLMCNDECNTSAEINASDADNVKGDAWARARNVLWGGDRGTLSLTTPEIPKATKYKQRMTQTYDWIDSNKDDPRVDSDLVVISQRQFKEHKDAIASNKESVEKSKEKNTVLDNQMDGCERGGGAIPPGAKSAKGSGKVGHSTNLCLGAPASFGYSHHTSSGVDDLTNAAGATARACLMANRTETITIDDSAEITPKNKKQRRPHTPQTTSANASAAADLKLLSGMFTTAFQQKMAPAPIAAVAQTPSGAESTLSSVSPHSMSTAKRQKLENIEDLRAQKKDLESTIEFKQRMGASIEKEMSEHDEVSKKLQEELKRKVV